MSTVNTIAPPAVMDLIHYGSEEYKPESFQPIMDQQWCKPLGGLWTSPVGVKHDWKEWCEVENFHTERLARSFKLRLTGTVLVIERFEDMKKMLWCVGGYRSEYPLFEEMLAQGIDAIHLTDEGQWATRMCDGPRNLYGWDCESVLVMNPKCIEPMS